MPRGVQRMNILASIDRLRVRDGIALARLIDHPQLPDQWPALPPKYPRDRAGIERLLAESCEHPWHPENIRQRTLDEALATQRVREMHWRMRRCLFRWPELRSLRSTALRLLETVIDLAREEAFPWFVNVHAEHVMFLARFDRKTFFDRLRELEALAITRPARRIAILDDSDPAQRSTCASLAAAYPRFPSRDNNYCVRDDVPAEPVAQWVIRYRRGIPHNAHRAAWWINYDLLCETGRVLPCFEAGLETLAPDYKQRNRWFGSQAHPLSEGGFRTLERSLALRGPLPPLGLRAALWDGL